MTEPLPSIVVRGKINVLEGLRVRYVARVNALFAEDEWVLSDDPAEAFIFTLWESCQARATALKAKHGWHCWPVVVSLDEEIQRERAARHASRLDAARGSLEEVENLGGLGGAGGGQDARPPVSGDGTDGRERTPAVRKRRRRKGEKPPWMRRDFSVSPEDSYHELERRHLD